MVDYTKRILVTGGCGFLGNALVRHLVKHHPEWLIVNLDALTYAGVAENLSDIEDKPNYRFEYGDVQDEFLLSAIFSNYAITDVIHLAAESHVDNSIANPYPFVFSNTIGTLYLLEAARRYWEHAGGFEGHKFYYFSTDEVFGALTDGDVAEAWTESAPLKPNSPYSASKASADLFCRAYHKTYGMPVVISHMCNAYGPRQFPEKLIPATIERILNDEPIIVYDEGKQMREWIHTDDVVDAASVVFEKGEPGESYNIGTGCEEQNIELVRFIITYVCYKTGKKALDVFENIKFVENARPGHDFRYLLQHEKIKNELGWESKVKLGDGLKSTIDWYLDNREWVKKIKTGEYKEINDKYRY